MRIQIINIQKQKVGCMQQHIVTHGILIEFSKK
jgi:hypothetical protein